MVLMVFWPMTAVAEPQGGTVTSGNAAIDQAMPGVTNITQFTDRVIINWERYGIGLNELVRYLQPNELSAALNRVTGVDPSVILGSLQANGRIFIINPNGILFGPQSKVDVGGLMASTLNMKDQDFLDGNYALLQDPAKALSFVVNKGQIKAADGGFVVLVAPLVNNEGTIVANLGHVVLGGASQATVNFDGQGLVNFSLPSNNGPTGNVVMSTDACADVLRDVVNHQGLVEAGQVIEQDGQVVLVHSEGTAVNSGSIQANGAPGRDAGTVTVHSTQATVLTPSSNIEARGIGENSNGGLIETSTHGNIVLNGKVDASAENGRGGIWLLDPSNVTITDATNNMSGDPDWLPSGTYDSCTIAVSAINSVLSAGTNVTVSTTSSNTEAGNITVDTAIDGTGGVAGGGLTLTANPGSGSVYVNAPITLNGGNFTSSGVDFSSTGTGTVTTTSGTPGGAGGAVALNHTGAIAVGAAITTSGASSDNASGGTGGAVSIETTAGDVTIGNAITASGGNSMSENFSNGGVGGAVNIAAAGNVEIGGAIATSGGHSLYWSGGTGGAISITAANAVAVSASVSSLGGSTDYGTTGAGGSINIATTAGGVTISGAINAGTGTVTLNPASGGVNQDSGGSIIADNLLLTGAGNFTLSQGNNVSTIAANVNGALNYNDANSLEVGTVGDVSGITTSDNPIELVTNNGSLTVNGNVDAGESSAHLRAQGSNNTLFVNGNVTGGDHEGCQVVVYEADNMELSGATNAGLSNTGILNTAYLMPFSNDRNISVGSETYGELSLTTVELDTITAAVIAIVFSGGPRSECSNNITIRASLSPVGSDILSLDSGGTLTQDAGTAITIANLHLESTHNIIMNEANNASVLAGVIYGAGNFSFTNAGALTVGSVLNHNGITFDDNHSGDVTLNTGGALTIAGNINAGTGTVTLNPSAGGVNQTDGLLTAAKLLMTGAGTFILAQSGNDVDTIAGNVSGSVSFTDTDDLIVGTVGAANGITSGGNSISLNTGSSLTLSQLINANNSTVSLTSASGAIVDGNGVALNITGGTLTLAAQNDIGTALDPLDLTVGTLNATATTGSMYLAEANAVTLGTIAAGANIAITNGAGTMTVNSVVFGAGSTATLTSTSGAIVDGNAAALNITGGTLTLTAYGSIGTVADPLEMSVGTLNATATTTSGSMYLAETDDVMVNAVTFGSSSGTAILTSTAGSILDGNGAAVNFTGRTLTLNAQGSIGSSQDPLETSVVTLNAGASTGSIYLAEANAVTLGTIAAGTDITITNTTGTMTVNAVTFGSGGTATLTSTTAGSILDGNGAAVNFTGGTLTLNAQSNIGVSGNPLEMSVGTLNATAFTGSMYLTETDDVMVNAVIFGAGGTAILTSTSGSILDGNGAAVNFTGGTLTLNAQSNIGVSGNPLEMSVGTLNATA
ncbi:MAG: filamentous hemagglutinin N-terminal domain-containing protein, partial [bacterium]